MLRYLILLILITTLSHSQNSKRLDSLLVIAKNQEGIARISTINEISWEFKNSNIDSAFYYARLALKRSKIMKHQAAIATSCNSLASCFDALGVLDSAKIYHLKSLNIKLKMNDSIGIANSYNNLGINSDEKGDYSLALQYYFKALEIYEKEDVSFDKIPMVLSNIGIVYKKQKEYDKTLSYYKRALEIYEQNKYDFGIVVTSGNIGSVLLNLKAFDSSVVYSKRAKQLYANLGYSRYIPYMLHNMAIAEDSLKQYESSQKDYKKAESLFEKDRNLYELSSTKLGLASSYLKQKKYKKALEKTNEALELTEKQNLDEFKSKAFHLLANIYSGIGDYKKAFDYSEQYRKANAKLFEEDKTKIIFELETRYETEKKEKEILSQQAEIVEKELNLKRKNIQIIGLGLIVLLLFILGYLIIKQQKLKNNQLKKESELKEALIKIETQNRLQEQRLRISRDLHDNIGAQLTFIISSIENLQFGFKIANDKLTDKLKSISEFTRETIYELRDTIWAMNRKEISLEDLQVRISNFIEKANEYSQKVDFKFDIHESVNKTHIFTSVQGMNIYRIIQEALNNTIKYANAKTVVIALKEDDDNFQIVIKDDGVGFDLASVDSGNGLNNMKKRAHEIGAEISIISQERVGTSIILNL